VCALEGARVETALAALVRALAAGAPIILLALNLNCASSGGGASATESARQAAAGILSEDLAIEDATLAGRFILEDEKGSRRGSLRVRYIGPDLYRVDAFLSGAAGAGGATSFLVEGDSTLYYADQGGGAEASSIERESVIPLLEDFNLRMQDLKALAGLAPYLGAMDFERTRGSRVSGGYLLEGANPFGDMFSVWIDTEKNAVVKGQRAERNGPPVVETKLSRFRNFEGISRATRIEIRHFVEGASVSVQYERMTVNEGLRRDDLLLRGMGS
jgi:hypothetical protein